MKEFVLVYWIVSSVPAFHAHAAIDGFNSLFSCEQAISQMRVALPKDAVLTGVCIDRFAYAMHWKGKPLVYGTGRIK